MKHFQVIRGAALALLLCLAACAPQSSVETNVQPTLFSVTAPGEVGGEAADALSSARERLEALVRSNDGFMIAEEDLRIRGPGEFFGFRQWGMPEFRVANLVRDADVLQQARLEAFSLLKQDPGLKAAAHQGLRDAMLRKWKEKLELGSIS